MCTLDENDPKNLAQKAIATGPSGRWRHYKGGLYDVIHLAVDEETLAPLVVYQSVQRGTVWTRTLDNWESTVEHEGRIVPRFVAAPRERDVSARVAAIAIEAVAEVSEIAFERVTSGDALEQVDIGEAAECLAGSAGDAAALRGKARRHAAIRAAAWGMLIAHEVDDQGERETEVPNG